MALKSLTGNIVLDLTLVTVSTECLIETNIEKRQSVGRGFDVSNLSPLTGCRVGPLQSKILRAPLVGLPETNTSFSSEHVSACTRYKTYSILHK